MTVLIPRLCEGGAERQLLLLARCLDKERFAISICTLADGGELINLNYCFFENNAAIVAFGIGGAACEDYYGDGYIIGGTDIFANRGGEDNWYAAFSTLGLAHGQDYDIYYTNGPTSGVGNGLGGRAGSHLPLVPYTEILYTAGDLGVYTLSPGEGEPYGYDYDAGDDIGVLTDWLGLGDRHLFVTGDNLVSDLVENAGQAGFDGLALVLRGLLVVLVANLNILTLCSRHFQIFHRAVELLIHTARQGVARAKGLGR